MILLKPLHAGQIGRSVERAAALLGSRYHSLVESLLHDSFVSDLLWTGRAAAMAGFGAFERHRQHGAISPDAAVGPSAVAGLSRCHAVSRPRVQCH